MAPFIMQKLVPLSFCSNVAYHERLPCFTLPLYDITILQVCSEETINEILKRYLVHNSHAASYTWKYDCSNLDMDKTLEENGIKDDDDDFYRLRMNDDEFLQCVHLYFNDDLTEA